MLKIFLAVVVVLPLLACGKQENPNNYPVSHWLNDPDPCVRKTAAAIVASGRPWPNETLDEKHRRVKFDFWIGDQLYELPGNAPFVYDGFSPQAYPLKYGIVSGNAEEFIGTPSEKQLKFKDPAVGGTLYGHVRCSSDIPAQWVEERWINAPTRVQAIDATIDLANQVKKERPQEVLRIEVNERLDIHMTEVRTYTNPSEISEASYFPIEHDVAQNINGVHAVKSIVCRPHDPDAKLGIADLCYSWIYLGPGLWIEFQVYQQMLPIVPDLHDKFLATFEKSRRK